MASVTSRLGRVSVAEEESVYERHRGDVIVTLTDVAVWYELSSTGEKLVIVPSLSLRVERGSVTVIRGRSGSGKTSILSIAAGLQRPSQGVVTWSGVAIHDLNDSKCSEMRRGLIGYVFQEHALIGTLTAYENVLLSGLTRRIKKSEHARAMTLLDDLGISSRAGHFPSQMSGGEQQRVAIARALFSRPACLVLDEPTASLDRRTADNLISYLHNLADEGVGFLIASHDPAVVAAADAVVTLD